MFIMFSSCVPPDVKLIPLYVCFVFCVYRSLITIVRSKACSSKRGWRFNFQFLRYYLRKDLHKFWVNLSL